MVAATVRCYDKVFIGGQWVEPAGRDRIEVTSPHDGSRVGEVPEAMPADVDRALGAASSALSEGEWTNLGAAERGAILQRFADLLRGREQEVGLTLTSENGQPVRETLGGQVTFTASILEFYAGLVSGYPFEEPRPGRLGPVIVRREPVGVVAAIIPWNYPLSLSVAKLAPALAAGCTVVLKPPPETPLTANLLAELSVDAGVPRGVLSVVPGSRNLGEYLVSHPLVDKVSFTGSTAAGRRVAAICGSAMRRVTLELGGKSAAILLDDVDVDAAAAGLVPAVTRNAGQMCTAQSRLLAPRSRYDEVVRCLSDRMGELVVGDPLDPRTEVGPLISARQLEVVRGFVRSGVAEGATLTAGGNRPAHLPTGWYIEPTVFADVDNRMTIAREEIFGPVLSIIPYGDVDEAIATANDSDYGLSGSVWGTDEGVCLDVARRVRSGIQAINGYAVDVGSPFGGFKGSGIGREYGREGLEAFLEPKSMIIARTGR